MANIQRGEAEFEANGVAYRLVMDMNAMANAEDAADMGIEALLKAINPEIDPVTGEVTRAPRIKHIGALLYGGLKRHHPTMTPEVAIDLLGESEKAGEALGKALQGALPKPDPSAEGKAKGARGTGTKPKPTGQRKG